MAKETKLRRAQDKSKPRALVSTLFSFLLVISASVLALLFVANFTLLRPEFLIDQTRSSGYILSQENDLRLAFVSYGLSSGSDGEFFSSLADARDLAADISTEIKHLYDPANPGVDLGAYKSEVKAALSKYVTDHGETLTSVRNASIDYLAELCVTKYKEAISIPLANVVTGILAKVQALLLPGMLVSGLLLLVSLGLLIAIQKNGAKAGECVLYSVGAAGIVLGVIAIAVLVSGGIQRVGIGSEALYRLITDYLNTIAYSVLLASGALLVSYVAGSLLSLRWNSFGEPKAKQFDTSVSDFPSPIEAEPAKSTDTDIN